MHLQVVIQRCSKHQGQTEAVVDMPCSGEGLEISGLATQEEGDLVKFAKSEKSPPGNSHPENFAKSETEVQFGRQSGVAGKWPPKFAFPIYIGGGQEMRNLSKCW